MLTCSAVEADAFSLLKPGAVTSHEISNVGYYDSGRVKKSEVIDGATAASKLRAKKSHAVSILLLLVITKIDKARKNKIECF